MFRIFSLSRSGVRLFKLSRYTTASSIEINTHNIKTIQLKNFGKHQRKNRENNWFNKIPSLLLPWGFGVVLCEAVQLKEEEKQLLRACQYGLALEVKR